MKKALSLLLMLCMLVSTVAPTLVFAEAKQPVIVLDGKLDEAYYANASWFADGLWQTSGEGAPMIEDIDIKYTTCTDADYIYLTIQVTDEVAFYYPLESQAWSQIGATDFRLWFKGDGMESRIFYDLLWDGKQLVPFRQKVLTDELNFAFNTDGGVLTLELAVAKADLSVTEYYEMMVTYSAPDFGEGDKSGYNAFHMTEADSFLSGWSANTSMYVTYYCADYESDVPTEPVEPEEPTPEEPTPEEPDEPTPEEPEEPTNVAFGKGWYGDTACTTSYVGNLTDGIVDYEGKYDHTLWYGADKRKEEDGIFTMIIDLGDVYDVSDICLFLWPAASAGIMCPSPVDFMVSLEGDEYEFIGSLYEFPSSDPQWVSAQAGRCARYVRIDMADNDSGVFWFVGEIEIYGVKSDVSDVPTEPVDPVPPTPDEPEIPEGEKTYENTLVEGEDGNCTCEVPYGYTWYVDYINGRIAGEDETICTTQDDYMACNPNWAITVYLELQADGTYVALQDAIVTPGAASNAGITIGENQVALVVHSASSNPDLGYANWLSKVVAMSVKAGDVFVVDMNAMTVYAVIPGEEIVLPEIPDVPVIPDEPTPEEPVNVALGKEVLNANDRGTYNADLTDGVALEVLTYNAADWFGYYWNPGMTLEQNLNNNTNALGGIATPTIDLGAVYALGSVRFNLFTGNTSGICCPESVTVKISNDGIDYQAVEAVSFEMPHNGENVVSFVEVTLPEGTSAQFVQLEIVMRTTFVFLNEIEIWTAGAGQDEPEEPEIPVPELPEGAEMFWVTHYNDRVVEGAGVIYTEGMGAGGWWLGVAFAPVENGYQIIAISNGLHDGGGKQLAVPEGGFVWAANYGNNYPALGMGGVDYTSINCNDAIKRALSWKLGDIFEIGGVDFETIPTYTPDLAWYEDAYVCSAYIKYVGNAPIVPYEGKNLVAGLEYIISEQYRMGGANVGWGYDENASVSYPDSNYELTDGLYPDAFYSESGWMAFNHQTPAQRERGYAYVRFDLGSISKLTGFHIVALKDTSSGISCPYYIEIMVSDDGVYYDLAGVLDLSEKLDGMEDQDIQYLTGSLNTSAQYVEVRIYSYGWAFLGEIEIYGTEAQVPTEPEILYGDVNGDGEINGKDVTRLLNYLASYDVTTGMYDGEMSEGADCNGDGVIDGRDAVRLMRYLANLDPFTGESSVELG